MKLFLATSVAVMLGSSAALANVPLGPLDGTTITGDLNFNFGSVNYFDPANGGVPSGQGYANQSSSTVTISGPSTEFGYVDRENTDTATFIGTQLIVSDDDLIGLALPWTMTFTDTAFASFSGLALSGSENFINGGLDTSISGDTITINWAGDATGLDPIYMDTFILRPLSSGVPDSAATAGLLGLAWAGLGVLKRNKYLSR